MNSPVPASLSARAMAFVLLAFGAAWIALLTSTSTSPPLDVIEQLSWVRSLEWGYYKHPPLPTWLMAPGVAVLGLSPWAAYLCGLACTLGAFACLWGLLRELRGPVYAAAGLLAALGITCYSGGLDYYNHDIVLLAQNTGVAWCLWRAFARRELRWWLAVGALLGLGGLTKYQIAITAVSAIAFALHQRFWRVPVHRLGFALASALALALFAPHAAWLVTHDFPPMHYAVSTSLGAELDGGGRSVGVGRWLLDQLFNRALPAWLVLAAAAWSARGRAITVEAPPGADGSRALLLIWGLLPLAFMPAVGLGLGAHLHWHWGIPFMLFVVPAAMELLPRLRWAAARPRSLLLAAAVVQALLLGANFISSPLGPKAKADRWRGFDSAAMARRVEAAAQAQGSGPIRIVGGDAALAGTLAFWWAQHPLVLIDGQLAHSPWLREGDAQACGWLEIGPRSVLGPQAQALDARYPELAWRLHPPEPGARACRLAGH